MSLPVILFSVLLATSQSPPVTQVASAAQDLKRLSIEQLAALEVTTATKQPERLLDTAAAIHLITGEDILRSGVTTLPDALRLAPGVIVNQSDANRWAVGIRGFADIFSKNVLVLIDGRSLYTPLVGGVHWAIQDVPLSLIDRIEVIRGPGASVWGANAVNGVINVITKRADATQGTRLVAATGTVEHARFMARYGGTAGDTAYRIYGKGFDRGGQFHRDGAEFDHWHSLQSGFRVDWKRGLSDSFTISGDAYRTQVGERADVSTYVPPSISTIDGDVDLTGANVIAAWQHAFRGGSQLRLQSFFDRTNREGFTFDESRTTWDVDLNVRLAPTGRHRPAAGINVRVSPSTVTRVIPTLAFLPLEHTFRVFSAFVHDDIALVPDRLSLGVGLKAESNTYTGMELLPSAQAIWTPAAGRRMWASVTRAVRTPSRFERDLDFQVLVNPAVPVFLSVVGSSDFDTETVVGIEAGYRQVIRTNLYLDVVAFENRYDGLAGLGEAQVGAETAPVPHVRAVFPFVNAVNGETRGVEVASDWQPIPSWRLAGSYSYLRLSLRNRPGLTNTTFRDNYAGSSPTHQVRVQSRIDLAPRVTFDQTYRYVSQLRAIKIAAYHSLDARLAWRLSPHVEASVVGQNLLAPHHAEFGAVPVEIRRSAYAQLTITR